MMYVLLHGKYIATSLNILNNVASCTQLKATNLISTDLEFPFSHSCTSRPVGIIQALAVWDRFYIT